ncbi:hypothetical protein [Yoonia sp. BS5-3]|uniref:Capsular polysaccharide export protein n=1 Tax=Yoonia phaeophyticola TaxID=3137369 RepID=A0ABZ3IDU4_9RHOB
MGDRVFCKGHNLLQFNGPQESWADWLQQILAFGDFETIILFGSERPAHIVARDIAANANVDVISLEEGYIRPGFVTVETGGNNASSPLAGQVAETWKRNSEPPRNGEVYGSFRKAIFYGALYYILRNLTTFGKRRGMFHRQTPLLQEAFYWARNLSRRVIGGERNFAKVQQLLEHTDKRYYLVPLQVSSDANLTRFASGWNSKRLISESIKSFATHAPPGTRLVFKIHPMDRGHNKLNPMINNVANACGVASRVDIIDTGSLGLLTRHSAGMITVNSTSGLSAIFHGVPLMVLGKAIYAHEKLAMITADFDAFWTSTHVASPELRQNYIQWIKQEALKPGDFYSHIGMTVAAQSVFEKLQEVSSPEALIADTVIPMKAAS